MKGTVKWFNAKKDLASSQMKMEMMYSYISPLCRWMDSRFLTKAKR